MQFNSPFYLKTLGHMKRFICCVSGVALAACASPTGSPEDVASDPLSARWRTVDDAWVHGQDHCGSLANPATSFVTFTAPADGVYRLMPKSFNRGSIDSVIKFGGARYWWRVNMLMPDGSQKDIRYSAQHGSPSDAFNEAMNHVVEEDEEFLLSQGETVRFWFTDPRVSEAIDCA